VDLTLECIRPESVYDTALTAGGDASDTSANASPDVTSLHIRVCHAVSTHTNTLTNYVNKFIQRQKITRKLNLGRWGRSLTANG